MSAPAASSPHLARLGPAQLSLGLIGLTSLLHLLVIGRFDLGVDEAHYALYGLHLDWSYFDHPPLVGWLQALVLTVSQHEFALRLWPLLLLGLSAWLLHGLTRMLFAGESPWLAPLAVAILLSGILFQLLGMALVPEVPLLLLGLAAMGLTYRAVEQGRVRYWLALGLCLGLAGLSKYTAVLLVLSVLAYIGLRRRWSVLAAPGPWLAALLAAALVAPVFWWNAQHDWISFAYQLGHGAPDRAWSPARFVAAQGYQMAAYAPGIWLFGLIALVAGWGERSHPGVALLLALSLPLLLVFAWGSGFEETLPHWTALAWAGLAPLSARWLLGHWRRRWVRAVTWGSLGYSLLLIGVLHSQLFIPWLPFERHRHPLGDLYGWREAATEALHQQAALGGATLMVGNWSLASRIAWYARPRPVQVTDRRHDQFDLWYGTPRAGDSGLLIVPDNYWQRPKAAGLAWFEHCALRAELPVRLGQTPVHSFRFYACDGYLGRG